VNPESLVVNPESLVVNPESLIVNPESLIVNPESACKSRCRLFDEGDEGFRIGDSGLAIQD